MEASKKNLIEAHKFNPYVSKKSYEILAQIYKSQNDFEELNKINIILESNFK